jgi:hypothetical protein
MTNYLQILLTYESPKSSFTEKKNSNSKIEIKKTSDVSLLNDFNTEISIMEIEEKSLASDNLSKATSTEYPPDNTANLSEEFIRNIYCKCVGKCKNRCKCVQRGFCILKCHNCTL